MLETPRKNPKPHRSIGYSIALLLCPLVFAGFDCGTSIKKLGPSDTITPASLNPTNSTNGFTISFAARTLGTDATLDVQGGTGSAATISSTCGSSGKSCACDFFTDSTGAGQVTSDASATNYSVTGNYLTCAIPSSVTASDYTHMRIRDSSNIRLSNIVAITNQDDAITANRLTLTKILGDLQAINVRKTYEYRCYINYLQKANTTTTTFDCGTAGTTQALSVVQVTYHYYLYADNLSNNFGSRVPDVLQTDGTGTLCGALIKFIDCTDAASGGTLNAPTLKFGIYSQSAGVFTVPVQLTNAPGRMGGVTSTVGYAGPYDTTLNRCPPGLVKKQNYKSTTAGGVVSGPPTPANSNVNSSLVDTWINDSGAVLTMSEDTFSGGTCNGTTCTPPNLDRSSVTPASTPVLVYTAQSAATDTYCVLPTSVLSGI